MTFDAKYIDFAVRHPWEAYAECLKNELRQCLDEGRDVACYEPLQKAISALPAGEVKEELANVFFNAMLAAPQRADYPYDEPNDLESIRAARPSRRVALSAPARDERLKDKIHGAWLGRICGCLLGKPVEGMRTPDIGELLKNSGNFPLSRYMTLKDLEKTPRLYDSWKNRTWADNLKGCAPVDDDTNYTVLAAKGLISRYGRDFTPADMANTWMDCQPKNAYCTAERRAFRNFVIGIRPPQSAIYKNPDREWIGAQIRGDYFGYINPADPETAADMAWRDACISHVKNGIYGEMYIAAMLAAAAATDDIELIIEAGLGEVPERSRLAEAVRRIVSRWREGVSQDECFKDIHARWNYADGYDWCHTISNAEIVTSSLLYGEKDYGRSICMAVQTGFDTDCNGATVGSILGMTLGTAGISPVWTDPIHDTLDTSIFGVNKVSVSDMVELTFSHLPASK